MLSDSAKQTFSISWDIAKRNYIQRFRGNAMGVVWILLNPLMMMCLYTVVFGYIFKGKYADRADGNTVEYALGIFLGIVVLGWFTETISASINVIGANRNLVKKVVFPLSVLPISVFIQSTISFIAGIVMVIIASHVLGYGSMMQLMAIPLIGIGMILGLGISFFVSSLGPFFRDLNHLVGFISLLLLNSSAVFFSISAIPQAFSFIVPINPFMHIIEAMRCVLLWGEYPSSSGMWILCAWAVGFFAVGILFFRSVQSIFTDVI